MSNPTETFVLPEHRVEPVIPALLWKVAGGLALTHVVLMFTGISQQAMVTFTEGVAGIEKGYVEGNMARIMTGGYIETLAFVVLVPVLVFLARSIGRRTEAARWAAQTALLAGMGYVAITLAVGFPAGAAALYAAQSGVDPETAFAINNIRIFGYFLSLALLGAHAIGFGMAAIADRFFPVWAGYGGIATGICLLAVTPLVLVGLQDLPTVIWVVWFVGVAVCLLRKRES